MNRSRGMCLKKKQLFNITQINGILLLQIKKKMFSSSKQNFIGSRTRQITSTVVHNIAVNVLLQKIRKIYFEVLTYTIFYIWAIDIVLQC